jgi:hypothetical protein
MKTIDPNPIVDEYGYYVWLCPLLNTFVATLILAVIAMALCGAIQEIWQKHGKK